MEGGRSSTGSELTAYIEFPREGLIRNCLCVFLVSIWTKLTALLTATVPARGLLLGIDSSGTLGLQVYGLMEKIKKI